MTLYETVSMAVTVAELADRVYAVQAESNIEEIVTKHKFQFCFLVVERNGRQIGWVELAVDIMRKTDSNRICDHMELFSPESIMPATTSVFDAIELLKDQWCVFCQEKNRISGVFSFGCFEKLAFKYLLFGIALEIEECVTRAIRFRKFTINQVLERLASERAKVVEKKMRRKKYPDLIEIITLADKMAIFLNDDQFFKMLPFADYEAADEFLNKLRQLRNRIAHGDIIIDLVGDPRKFAIFVREMNQLARHLQSIIPADLDEYSAL